MKYDKLGIMVFYRNREDQNISRILNLFIRGIC